MTLTLSSIRAAISVRRLSFVAAMTIGGGTSLSGQTWRASEATGGGQGSGTSSIPCIDRTGKVVAFQSAANDLVPGDSNSAWDIFVHDRLADSTVRISLSSGGTEANASSYHPAISDDARYVVFESSADNLVDGDTNEENDIFLHDLHLATTIRINVSTTGAEADGNSFSSHLSADGGTVVYSSAATNLVSGDTNDLIDVFAYDVATGTTARVSVAPGGESNGDSRTPRVSDDGRFVVYHSSATNLVSSDSNGFEDVFRYDRILGITERVSESTTAQGNHDSEAADLSGDGRFVAFESRASNLIASDTNGAHDIFVRDMVTGAINRVSVDDAGNEVSKASVHPTISSSGFRVAFTSYASDLVPGDTNGERDVFVRDRSTLTTERYSIGTFGAEGDGPSNWPDISSDGQSVAFESQAETLVSGDSNQRDDAFVHGPWLSLNLVPPFLYPQDPFELEIYKGWPRDPVILRIVELNGRPFFLNLAISSFDSRGVFSLRGQIPDGLSGHRIGLQGLAIGRDGGVHETSVETMFFQ